MRKRGLGAIALAAMMTVSTVQPAFAAAENAYAVISDAAEVKSDSVKVEITSPVTGSVVYAGYDMSIEADAEASAGIVRVEFYLDGEKFAEDLTAPYAAMLKAPQKQFEITARAYAADGSYNDDTKTIGIDKNIGTTSVTYLDADFESGLPIRNLHIDKKNETAEIVACPDDKDGNNRGGNVFYLKNEENKGAPWLDYLNADDEPLSGKVVFDFSFMSDTDWAPKNNMWFVFVDISDACQLMEFNGTNLICRKGPNSTDRQPLITDMAKHKWYDLKITVDFDSLTYDIVLKYDNVEKAFSGLSLPYSGTDAEKAKWKNIKRIRNRCTGNIGDGMYIDDWKIYQKPSVKEQKVWADFAFTTLSTPQNFAFDGKGQIAGVKPRPDKADDNAAYIGSKVSTSAPLMAYLNQGDPLSGTVVIEADVIPTSNTYSGGAELFFLQDANGDTGRLARFESTDLNLFKGAGGRERITNSIKPNKPYHFKYILDIDENVFDVEVTGEGLNYKKTGIAYAGAKGNLNGLYRVQFRVPGADSDEELGMYVDNLKIYALTGSSVDGVVFTSDSGVLSVDSAKVPYDLRSITVGFSGAMDESTLSKITLTDAKGTAVAYTGSYNSETNQYVMSFADALAEGAGYTLNAPSGVKGADGIAIDSYSLNITSSVREFAVNSAVLTAVDGEELDKKNTGGSMSAVVNVVSNSDRTSSTVVILTLKKNGILTGCAIAKAELEAGKSKDVTVTIEGIDNDISDYEIEVLLWGDLLNVWPVTAPIEL